MNKTTTTTIKCSRKCLNGIENKPQRRKEESSQQQNLEFFCNAVCSHITCKAPQKVARGSALPPPSESNTGSSTR